MTKKELKIIKEALRVAKIIKRKAMVLCMERSQTPVENRVTTIKRLDKEYKGLEEVYNKISKEVIK